MQRIALLAPTERKFRREAPTREEIRREFAEKVTAGCAKIETEVPFISRKLLEFLCTFNETTLYTNPTGQMNLKFRLLFNFDSGGDNRVQQPEEIDVGGAGSTVGIVLFGAPQSIYGATGVTYGAKLKKVYEENLIGSFKTAAMRITSDSTDPPFTLDSAVLQYRQNDRQ